MQRTDIAAEIVAMVEVDQKMRRDASVSRERWDPEVDRRNTARLREIVEQIGWPTCSKVGLEAEHGAWLLVQHADADREFQRRCLELMREQPHGEVCARHLAYLEDRLRIGEHRPQVYGTQLTTDVRTGELVPLSIEDADHADVRRRTLGLEPLAEYLAGARHPVERRDVVFVRFIGSGDAFGSGGRAQACILLEHAGHRTLLDCGATSLQAMKRQGIDPRSIDAVLVTHYHGDHAGGLPYMILDGQFSKRERPLVIAGPPDVRERLRILFDGALPGSFETRQRFEVSLIDLGDRTRVGALEIAAMPVAHLPSTEPRGLRVHVGGRAIAYTGDTAWCDALPRLAADTDLLIAEAYSFEKRIPLHLSHADLVAHQAELSARRIVLTHAGAETLARRADLLWPLADDGTELLV
jgi:ribonuclease BN (tRNA processing enzyme)